MEPKYIIRKTAWRAVTPLRVIFFFLIVPLIVMIVDIVGKKHETVEIYDDKIVKKTGVLSRNEEEIAFLGVYTVSIRQGFLGRMLGFGDVSVDAVGAWDFATEGVVDPQGLKKFLNAYVVKRENIRPIITE